MSVEPLYAVYGASGCGRGVMPLVRRQLEKMNIGQGRLVFVDDFHDRAEVNGQALLSYDKFLSQTASQEYAALAIADGGNSQKIGRAL